LDDSPASPLDDSVEFDLTATSGRLKSERDTLATEMIRSVMFALNWADVAGNEGALREFLYRGYEYNSWEQPTD